MFTLAEGALAVRAARAAIAGEAAVELPDRFDAKGGVFVTLHTHPGGELRGCVGYPEPVLPLREAVVDAARAAAFRDTRFAPVRPAELAELVVEVSLLTPPRRLQQKPPAGIAAQVEIGRHGLMVDRGLLRGILLPQVATTHGWDAERFLSEASLKAGLPPDAWLTPRTEVSVFEAYLFEETAPGGEVKPVSLA